MKKRKRGRPLKYKPEFCQSIIQFFDIAPHIEKDITVTYKDGTTIDKTEIEPVDLPFFSDWCWSVGISQDTMDLWANPQSDQFKPDFFVAYKRAKELQEKVLVTNGLRGLYAPAAFIFTAKNILKWRDEQYLKGDKDSPIPIEVYIPENKGFNGREKTNGLEMATVSRATRTIPSDSEL